MPFPKEQIQQARQADLIQYLLDHGYDLKREGQNFRIPGHGGLLVRANHWRQFSTGEGGNTLDFLVRVLGIDFKEAIEQLVVYPTANPGGQTVSRGVSKLEMPDRAQNNRRVIAYLTKTRGLPADVIIGLIKTDLLWQDTQGNCVFPCNNVKGEAQGAILEGTLSDVRWKGRAAGSDIEYGWWWPPAASDINLMTVVESPIDAMSLPVLRPGARDGYILAMGGLHREAIERFLNDRPGVRRVVLALDNDSPGKQATEEWQEWLKNKEYKVWVLSPYRSKDWNALLKSQPG